MYLHRSVAEALRIVTEHRPDVLVSDLNMPGEDGFQFVRRLRRQGISERDLPAVALSAMAHSEDRRRALLAGYQAHVAKPIEHGEFIGAIAALAGRASGPESQRSALQRSERQHEP